MLERNKRGLERMSAFGLRISMTVNRVYLVILTRGSQFSHDLPPKRGNVNFIDQEAKNQRF